MSGRRPNSNKRGYGYEHQKLRARIKRIVEAGQAVCARCGEPILPTDKWHLDHHDLNKRLYLGPSHARCNCATKKHPANRINHPANTPNRHSTPHQRHQPPPAAKAFFQTGKAAGQAPIF